MLDRWQREDAVHAADARLSARFTAHWERNTDGKPKWNLGAVKAVEAVTQAFMYADSPARVGDPDVQPEDLADAIALVDAAVKDAVTSVEYNEMFLFEAARLAGLTWAEIGRNRGYSEPNAGPNALRRYKVLRKQWPGHDVTEENEAVIWAKDPKP